jgi:hypothetical protein
MRYLLLSLYQVCSNKIPGVKIGPSPGGSGVIDFPYMCIVKTLKKNLLKSQRARA